MLARSIEEASNVIQEKDGEMPRKTRKLSRWHVEIHFVDESSAIVRVACNCEQNRDHPYVRSTRTPPQPSSVVGSGAHGS